MTKIELITAVTRRMPELQLYATDVYILALASRETVTGSRLTQDLGVNSRTIDRHLHKLLQNDYLLCTSRRPYHYTLTEKGTTLIQQLFTESQPQSA
jgi:DNA-binding MarR family transcriptional regulator